MMMRFVKQRLKERLKDERGLTLIEIIASSLIFFAVLIPLVSVYIRGVEIYQETALKNQLRNETDFIVGDVMRIIQAASYVKLPAGATPSADTDDAGENMENNPGEEAKQTETPVAEEDYLKNIFSTVTGFSQSDSMSRDIYLYERSVTVKNGTSTSELIREKWSLRQCQGETCGFQPFPVNHRDYIVDGLFQLDRDFIGESAEKRVTLYLVVALRNDSRGNELYKDLADVYEALSDDENKDDYIRLVRTEIDLGSLRKG